MPPRQERPSSSSGGNLPPGSSSGGRMSFPSGDGSGSRMSFPGGSQRGGRVPPPLGPRAFTEPGAATWDADTFTASSAEVYEVPGDEFSPNHWTPDYSQPRSSSAPVGGFFINMLTQGADDDLELLNHENVTQSTGGKGASKRGSNYSGLEDVQLCKSWIHISNDPIIGNEQSVKTYWERISADFHMNRDFESDRSPNSLEHRFGIILKECMKFHGFYEEVQRRHPSGVPYQEHMLEAHARYSRKANSKKFHFEQCWLTLRHTQKFESTLEASKIAKRPAKSTDLNLNLPLGTQQDSDSTAQGQESSNFSAKTIRPSGKRQSKEKLKNNEGDDEYKGMMQNLMVIKTEEYNMKKERWAKETMLEERKIKIEEERLQWEMEQKIMFCDVTAMDNDQRAYVLAKRAKLAKAASASVGETPSGESVV